MYFFISFSKHISNLISLKQSYCTVDPLFNFMLKGVAERMCRSAKHNDSFELERYCNIHVTHQNGEYIGDISCLQTLTSYFFPGGGGGGGKGWTAI